MSISNKRLWVTVLLKILNNTLWGTKKCRDNIADRCEWWVLITSVSSIFVQILKDMHELFAKYNRQQFGEGLHVVFMTT